MNPQLKTNTYPLPRPEDLFATLEGCKFFTKLDMSDAYVQLEFDKEPQDLCVINTHLGLRKYTRLPFGVFCAGSKFQKVMDALFRDLPLVKCYLDDLLVGGRTLEEHWERVMEVLQRLEAAGFRLKTATVSSTTARNCLDRRSDCVGHKSRHSKETSSCCPSDAS